MEERYCCKYTYKLPSPSKHVLLAASEIQMNFVLEMYSHQPMEPCSASNVQWEVIQSLLIQLPKPPKTDIQRYFAVH